MLTHSTLKYTQSPFFCENFLIHIPHASCELEIQDYVQAFCYLRCQKIISQCFNGTCQVF